MKKSNSNIIQRFENRIFSTAVTQFHGMRMEKLIKIIINEIVIELINRMTKSLKQILKFDNKIR